MNRIQTFTRITRPRREFFATLLYRFAHAVRMISDARRLDSMAGDRLDDMGIAPQSEANRRSSGDQGPVPHVTMW